MQETVGDGEAPGGGIVVGIEQGRERRARRADKPPRSDRGERPERADRSDRPDRSEQRQDRAEVKADRVDRRERRRTEKTGGDGVAADLAVAEPGSGLIAVEPEAQGETALATAPGRPMLVAPVLSGGTSQRSSERARVQLEQAEQALLTAPHVVSVVAPLIRHVNTVTEQLNEAHVALGRTAAERDALRTHLVQVAGEGADEAALMALVQGGGTAAATADHHERRAHRLEVRGQAAEPEEEKPNPFRPIAVMLGFMPEDETFDALKQMARRRQLFAAVVLVAAFTALRIMSAEGKDFSKMSRDGLADVAYVGMIFQVFLMAWMLYRVVRVGGKGVHWLFPDPNVRKRRR